MEKEKETVEIEKVEEEKEEQKEVVKTEEVKVKKKREEKVKKILLTIICFLVLVLSIVGVYFMYDATYGKSESGLTYTRLSTE